MTTPVDYASWSAMAKAQAVEDRLNQITANNSNGYYLVNTYANGWGAYSGRVIGLKVIDQATSVRVTGQFSGGTTTDSTAVFYVGDSNCWPGRVEGVTIGFSGGTPGTGSPYLEFGSNGWVTIYGGGNYSGGHYTINGAYPLDTY